MKNIVTILLLITLFSSCSTYNAYVEQKKVMPPIENDKPIYVFYKNYDELPDSAEYMGDISVDVKLRRAYTSGRYSNNRLLLATLEENVKKYGGNFLMIEDIDHSNASDMLNAKIYHVPEFGKTEYRIDKLKSELENKELHPLEGIYIEEILNTHTNKLITLKFGVIKKEDSNFQMLYFSGFENHPYLVGLVDPSRTWNSGDVYGYINKTEKEKFYEAQIFKINKGLHLNGTAKLDNKNLRIYSNETLYTYRKVFPDSGNYEEPIGSLTGFALDNKHILTCYHGVTDTEMEIFVKGINGNFNKKYKAVVEAKDKQRDLAVLRLVDSTVKLNHIPFPKTDEESSISEKVFVMGYPMSSMMGDDIKLTNGIISSTTGTGGNLKVYQISAPIQPGNSGSPLFDNDGNFIGVVNSGIIQADNVGYSLKAKYVDTFLHKNGITFETSDENDLSELPLVDKVKKLKNSIYLLEITNTEAPKPKEIKRKPRAHRIR